MARVEDMLQKMMRRVDASDENVKKMSGDLDNIWQKVDAHVVLIKHLELQMTQLSTNVNPRLPGTLPRNTIQNPENDGHCMEVNTRVGKQTIDPPMPFVVEGDMRKYKDVVEASDKFVEKLAK